MKKLLSVLLAGMITMSLAACGGGSDPETPDAPTSDDTSPSSINMVYGTDETPITVYKPENA